MRHSMRALVGVMLVGWICCPVMAAESGKKWWHFGQGREADVTLTPQSAPTQSVLPQSTLPPMTAPQIAPAPGATTSTPTGQQPAALADSSVEPSEPHWMINSPLAKVSWPRFHMPELHKPTLPATPWPKKSEANANRNAWAEPAQDPLKPSPIRRFGQNTRAAWQKTVSALKPDDESKASPPSSRMARRDDRSMWSRMFGSDEPKKKEGSQTIGEFIAQERIDP